LIFVNTCLFKDGEESTFGHIFITMKGNCYGFVGSGIVVDMVATFGTPENKSCLLENSD